MNKMDGGEIVALAIVICLFTAICIGIATSHNHDLKLSDERIEAAKLGLQQCSVDGKILWQKECYK